MPVGCLQTLPHGGGGDIEPSPNAVFLYNLGDECESLTGGWTWSWSEGGGSGEYYYNKNADHIHLYSNITTYAGKGWDVGVGNLIDLTLYDRMYVDVWSQHYFAPSGTYGRNSIILGANKSTGYWNRKYDFYTGENGLMLPFSSNTTVEDDFALLQYREFCTCNNTRRVLAYDISELDESLHARICVYSNEDSWFDTKVYRIWLDP